MKKKVPVLERREALVSNPFAGLALEGRPDMEDVAAEKTEDIEGNKKGANPVKGEVIFRRETAHRGGKTVVLVHGFSSAIAESQIAIYCKEIKQQIGCGGKVEGRTLEIQGEMVERLRGYFSKKGFRVRGG